MTATKILEGHSRLLCDDVQAMEFPQYFQILGVGEYF